jgi:hypothetical protein
MSGSYTITEWCQHRRLSKAMYYKLKQSKKTPRTYDVGASKRISSEADLEWLRRMEAESAQREAETA